jgi:hypothetical protein
VEFPAQAFPRVPDREPRWRRAAIVAGGIATVELIALVVVALAFIAKPFAHSDGHAKARQSATTTTTTAATRNDVDRDKTTQTTTASRAGGKHVAAQLPRTKTGVLVLNGNGRYGAAAEKATVVRSFRYPVVGTADASRRDYPRTIVMYRPGFKGEAQRFARDLGLGLARAVPLDGMRPSELGPAKVVLILGQTD